MFLIQGRRTNILIDRDLILNRTTSSLSMNSLNHLKMENCSNEDNDNASDYDSNLKLILRILLEIGIIFEYLDTSSIGQLLTSSRALLNVRGMNN